MVDDQEGGGADKYGDEYDLEVAAGYDEEGEDEYNMEDFFSDGSY